MNSFSYNLLQPNSAAEKKNTEARKHFNEKKIKNANQDRHLDMTNIKAHLLTNSTRHPCERLRRNGTISDTFPEDFFSKNYLREIDKVQSPSKGSVNNTSELGSSQKESLRIQSRIILHGICYLGLVKARKHPLHRVVNWWNWVKRCTLRTL